MSDTTLKYVYSHNGEDSWVEYNVESYEVKL